MKAFFLRHGKLHIWLLADGCLLAAFFALRECRDAMAALAAAMAAVRRGLGRVCYLVPFSVMEALCVLLALTAIGYVIWSAAAVARRGGKFRPETAAVKLTLSLAAAMSLIMGGFVVFACLVVPGGTIQAGTVLLAALPPWLLALMAWVGIFALGDRERRRRTYSALLGAVCAGLAIYIGFCYLWGVTYYVDNFQERSGIYDQNVAAEDLEAVTRYFAEQLNETAGQVERDEAGLFAVSRQDIFDHSVHAYDETERQFPFLAFDDRPPKAVHFSRIMSRLDFTGVYCPFTGESNVNVDSPACLLPSTIAHELAHQRGVALEQECNFLAILACTTCGDTAYAYSGWLLGYIYLGNALYGEDPELWEPVYQSLPESVRADLSDNNAYWRQFQNSTVRQASNKVYDSFLKGYGEEQGLKSYGMVVDLLVAYYKNLI